MPNHRITSGISASAGIFRTICKLVSSSTSAWRKVPVNKPSSKPRPPPIAKPAAARPLLTPRWVHNSPDTARRHAACNTAHGSGRMRLDNQPSCEASCQSVMSATGKIHDKYCRSAIRLTKSARSARLGRTELARCTSLPGRLEILAVIR